MVIVIHEFSVNTNQTTYLRCVRKWKRKRITCQLCMTKADDDVWTRKICIWFSLNYWHDIDFWRTNVFLTHSSSLGERLSDDVMFFRLEKSKQKSQVRPKLTKKSWVFNLEFFVELAESRNKLWLKKKEKKLGWPNVQDVELSGTCQVIISNFNFVKLRRFF